MKSELLTIAVVVLVACSTTTEHDNKGSGSIAHSPDYVPEMVAPFVISGASFEGHSTLNADNTEMFFVIYNNDHSYSTILTSRKRNEKWQKPEVVSFSGKYSDGSPALSPDGNKLFFSSNRPIKGADEVNTSTDLWVTERQDGKWNNPTWLGTEVNSDYFDFSPSVDKNGNLYFCSSRPGGFGDMDIYYAAFENGTFLKPILLDSTINSIYHEGNVGISPDGNLLFFMVQHKPGDFGFDDIHYSFYKNGWQNAKNLGSIVNTYSYDFAPKVSPDGKTLWFSSRVNKDFKKKREPYTYDSYQDALNHPLNGMGNIYKIDIEKLRLQYE